MPRPRKLMLVDERPAVPARPEDEAAQAPVVPLMRPEEASAIIAQLRAETDLALRQKSEAVQKAEAQIAEAERKAKDANETTQALRKEALSRIEAVEQERNAAQAEAAEQRGAREKRTALATAVCLGLAKQAIAEAARLASWLPALGALLGGFWLFDRTVTAAPSLATLGELALYGAVVVAPAVIVTLKGGSHAPAD